MEINQQTALQIQLATQHYTFGTADLNEGKHTNAICNKTANSKTIVVCEQLPKAFLLNLKQ